MKEGGICFKGTPLAYNSIVNISHVSDCLGRNYLSQLPFLSLFVSVSLFLSLSLISFLHPPSICPSPPSLSICRLSVEHFRPHNFLDRFLFLLLGQPSYQRSFCQHESWQREFAVPSLQDLKQDCSHLAGMVGWSCLKAAGPTRGLFKGSWTSLFPLWPRTCKSLWTPSCCYPFSTGLGCRGQKLRWGMAALEGTFPWSERSLLQLAAILRETVNSALRITPGL